MEGNKVSKPSPLTCPVLFEAPLLFVSFNFPNDIS